MNQVHIPELEWCLHAPSCKMSIDVWSLELHSLSPRYCWFVSEAFCLQLMVAFPQWLPGSSGSKELSDTWLCLLQLKGDGVLGIPQRSLKDKMWHNVALDLPTARRTYHPIVDVQVNIWGHLWEFATASITMFLTWLPTCSESLPMKPLTTLYEFHVNSWTETAVRNKRELEQLESRFDPTSLSHVVVEKKTWKSHFHF